MEICKAKELRQFYNEREMKLFFPSDVDDKITLKEFNEKFGVPAWVYCDTLEPQNPYRPLIGEKEKR